MPVLNGIGFGEHTALKQEHFEKLIRLHLAITASVQRNWRERRWQGADLDTYYYFDINAGAGHDPTGLAGSPLIFLRQAALRGTRYQAVLIERELINYQELNRKIKDSSVVIEHGDHADVLPKYFAKGPQRFGIVYADPSGDKPAFDLLGDMSRQPIYKLLDICIYVSATRRKRDRNSPKTREDRCLRDFLGVIDKKEWIIREPVGRDQWSFLIGSNWINFPDWKKEGFHSWKSPRGKEIFDLLTYTPEEIAEMKGQLTFPFFSPPDLGTDLTETTKNI